MIFQDSYASLNPRLTVEDTIAFGPRVQGMSNKAAVAHAHDLLRRVGLEPSRFAGRYPHEISGGQRQRVNIARGARGWAAAPDPRRSGVRARQIGRGAGAQPAARSQGRVRPHLHFHLARPQRGALHVGSRHGDVSRQGRRTRPLGIDLRTIRAIRTRRRCSPRCRRWIRTIAPRKRRFPAIRRTRSTRRQAVASTPDASTSRRCAPTPSPRCTTSAAAMRRRVIWPIPASGHPRLAAA